MGALGTQFTCFTGTTVQILTQKALRDLQDQAPKAAGAVPVSLPVPRPFAPSPTHRYEPDATTHAPASWAVEIPFFPPEIPLGDGFSAAIPLRESSGASEVSQLTAAGAFASTRTALKFCAFD